LEMTDAAVKLANIQTTIVGEKDNATGKTIRLSGKIQPDERLASSQVTHISGRIEKLHVSFTGEQVNKGQKIATLYSPELITAQRELLEALKLKDLNPDLVEAARNKLRYWKIGSAAIEQIEQKGKIQENFTVYSDETGIVTNRRVSVGDYIKQGEPLFDLMNLRKVWVLFDAYEEDLSSVSIGDKIEFTTPSIPNKTFKTTVTFIDPIINPNTRVASIRTEVSNSKRLLKPEMLVYGTLKKRASSSNQINVPKSAVMWTGKRSVVYTKVPDTNIPSFEFREIEIGEAIGSSYQVISGLEAGEEVVTYGSFTIDAAAQLNNQKSMMNRNVSVKGADHSNHLPDYTESTPPTFKEQLFALATTYLTLKDALVETDSEAAKEATNQVLSALSKTDMSLIKDDAHNYWMEQHKAIKAHGEKIATSDDIEEQRKQFDFLSQALIKSAKVFGIGETTLYVQHCPMANDNEGADWLSSKEEIRNPYFGDKMLTCGLVKTTIDKAFKNPPMPKVTKARQNIHNH
ncbi:MAG: efflux RND transporter periplasmic adaptor subunit, partial [Flavobacteriales bacterium]|nr:efflux RND transporter periplasmic adaptor subunit [Flavobacteriales bacterium]